MVYTHIVSFGWLQEVKTQTKHELYADFLRLADRCQRDGQKYIQSIQGGKNVSPEGHSGGIEMVWLLLFKNSSDFEYYLREDPAHLAFIKQVGESGVKEITVLDFENGKL